jgi:hypothetical protein
VLEPAPSRLHRFALIGAFLVGLIVPGVQQVGQRDQLAAILVFPFAMLAAQRAGGATASRSLSIVCGALAGIGIALKPFFLLRGWRWRASSVSGDVSGRC